MALRVEERSQAKEGVALGNGKGRETGSPQEPPEREAALLMPRLWLSEPIAGILTSRTVR